MRSNEVSSTAAAGWRREVGYARRDVAGPGR